ncbi:hypothetical protein COV06_00765 [Candidatus Uhrbacteria bacterium CG10_big_fil_rev_8_21_14_0_10_50_16]|uniref:Uncharacterized protein n=1 Tax=Candidatus Uhrbacteria bacterium CG10_big_fil_rev_8_21_14_0_10_50_16 TaxID=1975039 RepID=A0A2H0RMY7_9BACT|nr:MAG: hypothetical protein COV06_00765 [Candidatus Uhrbacteria bacterium CG10_big_fil_rev_8_21_14_0_10_50_16]
MTLGDLLRDLQEIVRRVLKNANAVGSRFTRYAELKEELLAALRAELRIGSIQEAHALPVTTTLSDQVANLFRSLSRYAAAL